MDHSPVSTTNYDLTVAYRIYPAVSKQPLWFSDDKFQLARFCLQSFQRALGGLRARIHVLLDGCPDQYRTLFEQTFDAKDLVFHPLAGVGNFATFGMQVDLLSNDQATEWVYFAEDDYFYLENQMETLLRFAQAHSHVDFATPYDHPARQDSLFHCIPERSIRFENREWTESVSTCLTFLAKRSAVRQSAVWLKTYGPWQHDASLWLSLTRYHVFNPIQWIRFLMHDRHSLGMVALAWRNGWTRWLNHPRYRLWTPAPSLATHMESTGIAPGVDWESEMRQFRSDG